MPTNRPTWHFGVLAKLDDAESDSEIVAIVRDNLAELTPDQLRSLPEDCWPGRLRDHDDISDYALRLGRRRVLSADSVLDLRLIEQLSNILGRAQERLARLPQIPPASADGTDSDEMAGRIDDTR